MYSRRQLLCAVPLAVVGLGGCLDETDTDPGTATVRPRDATPTSSSGASTSTSQPTSVDRTTADRTSAPTATTTPTTTATPTATPTPVATETVRIDGGSFEPRRLSVEPHTLVRWVNEDPDGHRIESMRVDGSTPWTYSSTSFDRGGAVGFRFDEPGVYAYYTPTWGRSTSCGLVRVGRVAFDGGLPCESTSGY